VVEILGGKAKVKVKRGAACESCKIDSLCKMLSQGYVVIEAENPIGAKTGQEVMVTIYNEEVLKASLILFGIPLICLLLGAFVGYYIDISGMRNLSTFLGSFIGVSLAFLGIKLFSKRYEREPKYRPVITKVI